MIDDRDRLDCPLLFHSEKEPCRPRVWESARTAPWLPPHKQPSTWVNVTQRVLRCWRAEASSSETDAPAAALRIGRVVWLPREPAADERPPRTLGSDVSLLFRHACLVPCPHGREGPLGCHVGPYISLAMEKQLVSNTPRGFPYLSAGVAVIGFFLKKRKRIEKECTSRQIKETSRSFGYTARPAPGGMPLCSSPYSVGQMAGRMKLTASGRPAMMPRSVRKRLARVLTTYS